MENALKFLCMIEFYLLAKAVKTTTHSNQDSDYKE